jgi:hypothetical protein
MIIQQYGFFSAREMPVILPGKCWARERQSRWAGPLYSVLAARVRSADDRNRAECIIPAHRGLQEEEVE